MLLDECELQMNTQKFEVSALVCFILAGFFYMVSAVINRDYWVITGTIIWLVACLLWLIPVLAKGSKTSE